VLAAEERALEVHGQDAVQLLLGRLGQLLLDLDGGVVEHRVQPAEALHGVGDECLDLGLPRHIGVAVGPDALHRLGARRVVDVAAEDVRALRGELGGEGTAEARRHPRHDDAAPLKPPAHAGPSRRR
jgi:hypothetical protein